MSTASAVARLRAQSATLTTATVAAMEERHAWFAALAPEHRSWITVVARAGIDGFADWVDDHSSAATHHIFDAAPRTLLRRVSLLQTVDLVRTTIDVCEERISDLLSSDDNAALQPALLSYGREVAFAAAEVYARAAELRGSWDSRLEALVVDAIVRGEADESVISRASALGWESGESVCVLLGSAPSTDAEVDELRAAASAAGLDVLVARQGERLLVVIGGGALDPLTAAEAVADHLGPGSLVVGPVVDHLIEAGQSARAAFAALGVVRGWPEAPRPVCADDLLPERALGNDPLARRALVDRIYTPLEAAGGDLIPTAEALFAEWGSVEAASRALFVHPNTVRYRLKRIREITGYSLSDGRDSYAVRLALTLGRSRGL